MQELVFARLFLSSVERHADATSMVALYPGETYEATYAQHVDRVLCLRDAVRTELAVGPEDRFAIMAGSSHHYQELWHAAFLGAGILNPLNIRLSPDELTFILKDSGTKVAFVDSEFGPVIDSVRKEAGLERVVLIGDGDIPHDVAYEKLVESGSPRTPEEPAESDPVVLMYTGGTTGLPKGVVIPHKSIALNAYRQDFLYRHFSERYTFLQNLPMFHVGGSVGTVAMPVSGGKVVLTPSFDPVQTIEVIEEHEVTLAAMASMMFRMVLDHPEFASERLSSLQVAIYGAAPMPTGLLDRMFELLPGIDIIQSYGMTEAGGGVVGLSGGDHRDGGAKLRSAGRALPGVALSIRDPETGEEAPIGESGEICIRSGGMMTEYWNRPEETEAAFREGWYHTGDMGYLDDEHYVYVVDRVKDMIVTGGENVYSIEVENAISTHPAVAQAAVIGIPDEKWGEAVHAVVVLKPDAEATAQEIQEHVRSQIAGYKTPKSVEFRSEPLELSGAGKILKRELRKPYWENQS